MSRLQQAASGLVEHPLADIAPLHEIEQRASSLTRRRRIGRIGAVAVVVVAALVSVSAIRSQRNDESIVVGPSPNPQGSLEIPVNGVGDQAQADGVAQVVFERIQMLNLGGQFPRLGFDPSSVAVTATPNEVTISAPTELLPRLTAHTGLWADGDAQFVAVEADTGPTVDGRCSSGVPAPAGSASERCYLLGTPTGLDHTAILGTSAGIDGSLLVGWRDGEPTQSITELAVQCAGRGPACPTSQVALVTDVGVVALFEPTPATPPGTPSLRPASVSSFDNALAVVAMLRIPLPDGVALEAPAVTPSAEVLVALSGVPAGTIFLGCCYIEAAALPRELVPSNAVLDTQTLEGKSAVQDIPRQSVIVEGMFE